MQPLPRIIRRSAWLALAAGVLLVLGADGASACPSCKEALAAGSGGGDLVGGFFWSILFMLSMPFVLLGSFGLYFYYLLRKARTTQPATEG